MLPVFVSLMTGGC